MSAIQSVSYQFSWVNGNDGNWLSSPLSLPNTARPAQSVSVSASAIDRLSKKIHSVKGILVGLALAGLPATLAADMDAIPSSSDTPIVDSLVTANNTEQITEGYKNLKERVTSPEAQRAIGDVLNALKETDTTPEAQTIETPTQTEATTVKIASDTAIEAVENSKIDEDGRTWHRMSNPDPQYAPKNSIIAQPLTPTDQNVISTKLVNDNVAVQEETSAPDVSDIEYTIKKDDTLGSIILGSIIKELYPDIADDKDKVWHVIQEMADLPENQQALRDGIHKIYPGDKLHFPEDLIIPEQIPQETVNSLIEEQKGWCKEQQAARIPTQPQVYLDEPAYNTTNSVKIDLVKELQALMSGPSTKPVETSLKTATEHCSIPDGNRKPVIVGDGTKLQSKKLCPPTLKLN